jgi:hypothetical protein
MRCDHPDIFALNILGKYKHFVLKENLFSLKDLCDIYEMSLGPKLREFFHKFENHILVECEVKNK